MASPFRTGDALLKQQGHRVLIGGKIIEEWSYMEPLSQPFQAVLITREGLTVHKRIVTGVFPFNNNVQTGCHRFEFSGDGVWMSRQLYCGNPIDYHRVASPPEVG